MKEDNILSLLLQAEQEYQAAVKRAVKSAEAYAGDRKEEQAAYIEKCRRDWQLFQEAESEKLERALSAEGQKMEEEAAALKAEMKRRLVQKADEISERLKEEVLSTLWQ